MPRLTFTLEQEEVGAVAEGRTEVRAVLHQVAGEALPVEGAHSASAGGEETAGREPCGQGADPQPGSRPPHALWSP